MFQKILAAFLLLPVVLAGCSSGASNPRANTAAADAGDLGDLSEFKKIAEDTLSIVEKKDMPAAKTRIKDLETAWDKAEATLKPKSEATWTAIDKAIDHALAAVRKEPADPDACGLKLKAVLVKMTPKNQTPKDAPAK